MSVEDRLRHAAPPDAEGAHARAARVVAAAAEAETARAGAPRRSLWHRCALAAVAVLALAVAVTPPGDAVARWVKDLVTVDHAPPPPKPVLASLPSPGELLVSGPSGAWVVGDDGARRRLGTYADLAWSPRGLFVAAVRGHQLLALDPRGRVRWTLSRTAPVSDPVWLPPTGYRIAYRSGTEERVVAGDSSGDHALTRNVADVPAAWLPGTGNRLVVAHRDGRVEAFEADTQRSLWSVGGGPVRVNATRTVTAGAVRRLAWTSPHHVVIVRRRALQIVCGGGCVQTYPLPAAADQAAVAPDGRTVAVTTGRTVRLVNARTGRARVVLNAAGPVSGLAFAPDGSRLLVASGAADQWVFVPLRAAARISAVTVRGFPQVGGWCCS